MPTATSLAALASMLVTGWGVAPSTKRAPAALPAEPMKGPFESLEAACAGCTERATVGKPAAPFLDVRVVVSGDKQRPGTRDNPSLHYLAVRIPSGWWLHEIGRDTSGHGKQDDYFVSLFEKNARTADVLPGGAAEILIETEEWIRGDVPREIDKRRLHVCGVGRSGQPSCTWLETYHFAGRGADSWDGQVTFQEDGTIVTAGKAGTEPQERRYVVRFP